ncbi:hypothetical protein J2795_001073 [Chryseobacterium bernardetii]|uniref:Uncharacterized protein n=2 Tax=Chryseobacterium TaxID=59732 RepID=A0A543EKA4_9FLAO|nr:hypothetical protein [Chryseobacterium vietnamense]MDR6370383.1 hypothetical protein [Chryseobacterium vietnamense]MDR6440373.1 hypothetical protein [Chryseobacterium bernardetii]TQM21997.1 hypothetical protein FB551_1698 [Chryseobacterium aquifrigidense]
MMIILYLLILFPIFLKKYLDYQDSQRNKVHYLPLEPDPSPDYSHHDRNLHHDQKSQDYFDLVVRCLIFCTFDDKKYDSVADCLSLTDIGYDLRIFSYSEEIESLFRNKFISESLRQKIADFKKVTDEVDEEEWYFESLDLRHDERWKKINVAAEDLLTEMNIKERDFDFALYVPR